MPERQPVKDDLTGTAAHSRGRVADYIADMVEEMERLARREKLGALSELLDAAGREARRISLIA